MAVEAAERETERAPDDASAWERLGRLRLRTLRPRGRAARRSSARARSSPSEQGLLDLALVANLLGDVGAEVSACEQATQLAPDSPRRLVALAHALARTDRTSECLAACERALALLDDPEVRDLRAQVVAAEPRAIEAAA